MTACCTDNAVDGVKLARYLRAWGDTLPGRGRPAAHWAADTVEAAMADPTCLDQLPKRNGRC